MYCSAKAHLKTSSSTAIPKLLCLTVTNELLQHLPHNWPSHLPAEFLVVVGLVSEVGAASVQIATIYDNSFAMERPLLTRTSAEKHFGASLPKFLPPRPPPAPCPPPPTHTHRRTHMRDPPPPQERSPHHHHSPTDRSGPTSSSWTAPQPAFVAFSNHKAGLAPV